MTIEYPVTSFVEAPSSPIATAVDIRSTTPERNFACAGKSRSVPLTRSKAELSDISTATLADADIRWPDLYPNALALADRLGITSVIAVGCDEPASLLSTFSSDRYHVVGIEHLGSLAGVRKLFPTAQWYESHLGSKRQIEATFGTLDEGSPHVIVMANILERIPDPRNLLFAMRSILLRHPDSRLVLTTPDRHRVHGDNYDGFPMAPLRVREWTLSEVISFLASAGFTVEHAGYTRADAHDTELAACYLEISCVADVYDSFLLANGMSHTNAAYAAMLTAEHCSLATTGGIGTYASYVSQLDPKGIITVYIGQVGDATLADIVDTGWIHPFLFFSEEHVAAWPVIEQAWKTTEHLLFYFHHLEVVEYQDYQGLGARVAQAKNSGLISSSICVHVMCHGNQAHVDNSNETWRGLSLAESWLVERIALEKADRVFIPTDYLHELYLDIGYDLGDRVMRQRLPYFYSAENPLLAGPLTDIDTLIFFGKLAPLKGIAHFIDAVLQLDDLGRLTHIREIVFLGGRIRLDLQMENGLAELARRFHVTYISGTREEALQALQARRANSLVVMPYLGDNHPYSVLEVIDLGMSFVTYQRGGIPSLIPDTFKPDVLATATPAGLAEQMLRIMNLEGDARQALFDALRQACAEEQEQINRECLSKQFHWEAPKATQSPAFDPHALGHLASVVVPVYNTNLAFVRDLCFSLNAQSVAPKEIIFVNDGSEPGYMERLQALLEAELHQTWRLITQENRGLAGARNTGLRLCATKYLITLDSDDVVTPDFVHNIVQHLELDPSLWATSSYIHLFHEDKNEDWQEARVNGDWHRPLGEALIYGQIRNTFGSGCAGYHVERLRSAGGWDETDKTMWEDWACYLNLVSHGGKLGVIPTLDYLYRIHQNSMLRTYASYPATRRLARNTTILPRWEAYVLQSMMRDYDVRNKPFDVLFLSEREQVRLLAEQNVMLAELRQWGADQAELIANYEKALEEQRTMLAELRQVETGQGVLSIEHRIARYLHQIFYRFSFLKPVLRPAWRGAKWMRRKAIALRHKSAALQ